MTENTVLVGRYLDGFRERFEPVLNRYLQEKISCLAKIDLVGGMIGGDISDFTMEGGKRIRAALVELGYKAAGQEGTDRILLPAIAVELMHSFFLIHDDIIDRSELRRNRPTMHRVFEERYHDLLAPLSSLDRQHFVYSMALLAGDLCCAIAYEALSRSDFAPERVIRAISCLHLIMDNTLLGEALDTLQPLKSSAKEEVVLKIQRLKTAKYTIEGPLRLGMILAGASEGLLLRISNYAIPVGIAFQIHDDILGVFGTQEELGKSTASDIEEGKQTFFTAFIKRRANQKDRKRFFDLLGKKGLTNEELEEVRAIIKDVGALKYAQDKTRFFIAKGKKALSLVDMPGEIKILLQELADYLITRTV